MRRAILLHPLLFLLAAGSPLGAQQPYRPAEVTASDYARAERHLAARMGSLVTGMNVRPSWLPDGRFWYTTTTSAGEASFIVDPVRATRRRCEARDPCTADSAAAPPRSVVLSPDGRRGAFVRDHDLWVRDIETGRETRLTHDGEQDFAYATNNAGWTRNDRPVLVWAPDSRRLVTFQHDGRGTGEMVLTSTNVGQPRAEIWKYPLPGDSTIFTIHRTLIDLDAAGGPRVTKLQMPPDAHRSTICDHVVCGGEWIDNFWSADGSRLAFVSTSRDHQTATLRVSDTATGAVRDVMHETVPTFYEAGARASNIRVLFETDEVIWYSQRDDWGHLYLYDLASGALKQRITSGSWNVAQILDLDAERRTITFLGNGREPGDPYFQYLYRVNFDGSDLRLLTPDSGHHTVALSPDRRFIVDTWSTPTDPPVTVLRDADGARVLEIERADISRLVAAGWQPPQPFTVKARDGTTELHGLLFRPSDFDPARRYPIINNIYPGPQSGSVGTRSFAPARGDLQALAELGFIVIQLDAMGTPNRSKSFHAAYYGDMGDNGLPDQIAGMRQLADRYPWIDIERAGIYGGSGGGFASTAAILRYPDFFKVAVSAAGNHDNRNYADPWGEKWHGLLDIDEDGTTSYDRQANQLLAHNLRGKLLLIHGTMDNNVPPYNTYLVVDALIAANKDFDLLMLPNRRHGTGEPYVMRRRWDYFVRHLLGAEPPKEYEIGRPVQSN